MHTERPIRTYALVWFLSLVIVSLEIGGSMLSGSRALLADIGHVASDTLLALVPLSALLLMRWNVHRRSVEIGSGLVAAAFLLLIGMHVGGEALESIRGGHDHAHEVDGILLFVFSGLAAVFNIFQHRLLRRVSPEHHHAAHKGLHFHVLMDLVKNIALPALGLGIAAGILADGADLWAALLIGALLIVRGLALLYTTLFARSHGHA